MTRLCNNKTAGNVRMLQHSGALLGAVQRPAVHAAVCRGVCITVQHCVQADEDGDNMDFESLISQLFEVLITLISNRRHQDLMQPIVPELIYHTIGNHPTTYTPTLLTQCCISKSLYAIMAKPQS